MTKIKLCAVSTISNTIDAFMLESLIDMSEKGFEITVICDMDEAFIEKIPKKFKYYNLEMKRKADLFGGIKSTIQLYKYFKKNDFDMIQYTTPNASFYTSLASFFAAIPTRIYCQWGIRYVGFNGIKRSVFKTIENITCALSTDIRAASRKNMEFAINEKLYNESKAKIIGDGGTIGVDLIKYERYRDHNLISKTKQELGISKEFVFGFVGSIRKDKGVNELLGAFKELTEKYSDIMLVLVGKEFADDPVESNLLEWAQNSKNVIFSGFTNEVPKYISIIDMLVHPSYREGFSMVIQEASALEKPIITTDIPGPSEVIEENVTGLLVPVKSRLELAKTMEYSINNKNILHEMGLKGRQRIEKLFTRSRMLKLTLEDRKSLYMKRG